MTQTVDMNDSNLGSFHDWLKKMANHIDVDVVANYVGKYELPDNVSVFSLGKEKEACKLTKILRYQLLLLRLMPGSKGVFFHMCPEYVIGAGLCVKIFRKKSLLWYAHKSTNWKLKLAEKLVNKIFTPSKESFRLSSGKVEITGHGINMERFRQSDTKRDSSKFKIISAGRIAPIKNTHLLIDVAEILRDKNLNDFEIEIAGTPVLKSDEMYFEKLKKEIQEKKLEGQIIFAGSFSNKDMVYFYQKGDLFVNFSDTGSIDRAVLEAMSCGLNILTSNESFKNVLKEENLVGKNPEDIANKIIYLAKSAGDFNLREYVVRNHNLDNLVKKIIKEFE